MRRPLSGALLGIIFGLAIAVIFQQMGLWPLDRITFYFLPAIAGLLGILIGSIGRQGSMGTMIVALIITIPMAAWGATGFTMLNENGELNGGCEVVAASDIDATTVTNTTRSDPFSIDPDGGLTWSATSPAPITDHTWDMWVEIGDVRVTIEEGADENEGMNTSNEGSVPDITQYAEERGIAIDQLRGVFKVGGDIDGTGGSCDGFAFVELTADPFETLISQIAAGVAVLSLIGLLLVALTGRPGAGGGQVADVGGDVAAGAAAGAAGAAGVGPSDEPAEGAEPGQELIEDISDAAEESGFAPDDDPDVET